MERREFNKAILAIIAAPTITFAQGSKERTIIPTKVIDPETFQPYLGFHIRIPDLGSRRFSARLTLEAIQDMGAIAGLDIVKELKMILCQELSAELAADGYAILTNGEMDQVSDIIDTITIASYGESRIKV